MCVCLSFISNYNNFIVLFLRERKKSFFTMERYYISFLINVVLVGWVAVYTPVFSLFFIIPTVLYTFFSTVPYIHTVVVDQVFFYGPFAYHSVYQAPTILDSRKTPHITCALTGNPNFWITLAYLRAANLDNSSL